MNRELISALRASTPEICERWQTYLEEEPVTSPLGQPALLTPLFKRSLDEFFTALSHAPSLRARARAFNLNKGCACAKNPFIAYYRTGERALIETLTFLETPTHNDWAPIAREIRSVFRPMARRKIRAFCALCQDPRAKAVKPAVSPALQPIARRVAPAPSRLSNPTSP